jgi:hypothetical protein
MKFDIEDFCKELQSRFKFRLDEWLVPKVCFQGISEQFPGDSWIHFRNTYFEVFLCFNERNVDLLKIITESL